MPRDAEHRRTDEEGNDCVEAVVTRVGHRRKSESMFARSCGNPTAARPGERRNSPQSGTASHREIGDVGTREESTEHAPGSVKSVSTTP